MSVCESASAIEMYSNEGGGVWKICRPKTETKEKVAHRITLVRIPCSIVEERPLSVIYIAIFRRLCIMLHAQPTLVPWVLRPLKQGTD